MQTGVFEKSVIWTDCGKKPLSVFSEDEMNYESLSILAVELNKVIKNT